jgi:hypothetical protein
MRRFELHRAEDVSGVSGIGLVAEGVEFADGTAALKWHGEWASVNFHERGMESVRHIHGHDGSTRVVFLDPPPKETE